MTTIAWDGKSVAADSMKSAGVYVTRSGSFEKLVRRGQEVFAFAGSAPLFAPMIEWYLAGADAQKCPKDADDGSSALIVFKEGRCFQYILETPYPEELFAPDAFGAGSDFAIGAIKAGASVHRAIEIASECTPHTGGAIQVIDLTFQQTLKLVS